MDKEKQARDIPARRIALLIDAENIPLDKIDKIIAGLSKYGESNIRRAYGNWARDNLKAWKGKLHEFAIQPVQQFNHSTGKNAADIALAIDAMELLYTQKPDAFCLASSDADFTPLVMKLKANGPEVYGFGQHKAPAPFVDACTAFTHLDTSDSAVRAIAAPKSTAQPRDEAEGRQNGRPLSQNAKLIAILRDAVKARARKDGWAPMSEVGSTARLAGIERQNYGAKTLTKLFAATGLFDIAKLEGKSFVADKRNRDRTPQPIK